MIHSFSCKNFYSFKDEISVSFVVSDNAADNQGYFYTPSGTRLSKVETIIGANASGKTNLLKILPFLKWLIVDSLKKPSNVVPVKSFAFGVSKDLPTELSVDFEVNDDIFSYFFSLTSEKILSEVLTVRSKTKTQYTKKKVFSRSWNEEQKNYDFWGKGFHLPKEFEHLLPSGASIVALANGLNHKLSQSLVSYWEKIETNVIEAGWIGDRLLPNADKNLIETLNFYSENDYLKVEAEKLLQRFDLGLSGIDIHKEKQGDGVLINVKALHYFDGEEHYLPLKYESSGTKQLFILLKTILKVLANGGVAIIDEFDVNLHPDMISSLFELFLHTETNPHHAQLLFSTHSHIILNKLDKYQIVLIEKNSQGVSDAWRLDEMNGVRADDNYFTKYIAGAYGAVPRMD